MKTEAHTSVMIVLDDSDGWRAHDHAGHEFLATHINWSSNRPERVGLTGYGISKVGRRLLITRGAGIRFDQLPHMVAQAIKEAVGRDGSEPVNAAADVFAAAFGDGVLASDLAERMTCTEVDALADLLNAVRPGSGDSWIEVHRDTDEVGDIHWPEEEEEEEEG